jgi:hypothetical protein
MDGTLAFIWLITSLTDMTLDDCPDGCLKTEKFAPEIFYQFADVQFNDDSIAEEFYLGYDSHRRRGPFRPTYGLSLTTEGSAWFGIGWKWSSQYVYDSPLFVETSMMPGFYAQRDGPDLGGTLQFRSALGVGYEFDNGSSLTVSYDHRSNADTNPVNPGLETLSIRYGMVWE